MGAHLQRNSHQCSGSGSGHLRVLTLAAWFVMQAWSAAFGGLRQTRFDTTNVNLHCGTTLSSGLRGFHDSTDSLSFARPTSALCSEQHQSASWAPYDDEQLDHGDHGPITHSVLQGGDSQASYSLSEGHGLPPFLQWRYQVRRCELRALCT